MAGLPRGVPVPVPDVRLGQAGRPSLTCKPRETEAVQQGPSLTPDSTTLPRDTRAGRGTVRPNGGGGGGGQRRPGARGSADPLAHVAGECGPMGAGTAWTWASELVVYWSQASERPSPQPQGEQHR